MGPQAIEQQSVSLTGYHSLEDRPAFKIALNEHDGRLYAYTTHYWHSGWSIVDVTDPADPELVNFVEGPAHTITGQIQIADDTMVTSLERPPEGYGPAGEEWDPSRSEEGAYLWDLSDDPLDPELRGHYRTGVRGTHRNFYDGGDYAYMCVEEEPFAWELAVVDVSDLERPEEVARWTWATQSDGTSAEDSFYFHGPAYVVDDRAYTAYGRIGGVLLDVSDPTDPSFVNRISPGYGFGSRLGVHSYIPIPDTDLAVMNTEALSEISPTEGGDPLNYTVVVDVSDEREAGFDEDRLPTGPRAIGWIPVPQPEDHLPYDNYYEKGGRFGPHNQHHPRDNGLRYRSSDWLIMTYFNAGLRIFDISDPLAPTEAGHFVADDPDRRIGPRPESTLVSHFEDVVVDHRGYIYCTDLNQGLFVLESELL